MANIPQAIWSVVTVAREPPDVLRRFVAWHLASGAAQITIFFDDPTDPCIEMVAHLDQVRSVACTADFWASLGLEPTTRFTKRQNWACHFGYEQSATGWVLNIDADELLYCRDRRVGEILSDMPDDVRDVLVLPAEQVLVKGGELRSVFRQKTERELVNLIYGDLAPVLWRNHGMVGHSIGKSIIRTGLKDFWMQQHYIKKPHPYGDLIIDRVIGQPEGAFLLHYFSRGYDDWRRKLDYRVRQVGFRPRLRNLLAAALETDDPRVLPNLYARLHSIDEHQHGLLESNGLLVTPDINPDDIITRYF
jgi:Glycosyl transferase family 2